MSEPVDELEDDWLHGLLGVLREEVLSISADFGRRVKNEIDNVADLHDVRPPSATALLTAVAIESTNITLSLLTTREPPEPSEADDGPGTDGAVDPDVDDPED